MANLEDVRQEIDTVDTEMVSLLDKRAKLAHEIGKMKLSDGKQKFFDPARQKMVLDHAVETSTGEFPQEALRNVFIEIMSGCLMLEKPLTIGYLGPEGTFSHEAAINEFGNSAALRPYHAIREIFIDTDRDRIDYGVVPIENSTGGVIHATLDMFFECELLICSEVYLPIHQNLISRNPLDRIKTIYSRAEPFQQCQNWLQENLPGVQLIEVSATSKAVEMCRDRDYAGAIGSELAARKYNVPILAPHIEDMKDNTTRFLVIGKQKPERTGKDKTSVMLSIKDKPGALFDLLQPFKKRSINLTKIESRPTRIRAWDYAFFVDIEGHITDEPIADCLKELEGLVTSLRVMGSYPRDVKTRDSRPVPQF